MIIEDISQGFECVDHLIPGAGAISLVGILAITGFLWKMWRNDLKHIAESQTAIRSSLERIENKLDEHINAHAKGDFKE